jgi:hypothetical protein
MNECSQFLPSFNVRFVTSFSYTFCSFSSCKFFFLFLALFSILLPSHYFLHFWWYLYSCCLVLPFIFLLLFPALSPISFSVYFPSFFVYCPLFIPLSRFRFRISVSTVLASFSLALFLRCSLSLRIHLCSWFPYRPRLLLPELESTHIIQNLETMHSLRVHEYGGNGAVTTQKHITIYLP